jgi:hypothetical protein
MILSFYQKIGTAPIGGGFRMDGYWVWCGSVIQGDDGKYHMFASRWPHDLPFVPHWVTNSEIVRAVSDTPEGPYTFAEVVLPPRGPEYWDGRMTHNPTIHKHGDTYLLYYIGSTYEEAMPNRERHLNSGGLNVQPLSKKARANQRIGLATAKSVEGPWLRADSPILEPRPGQWDGLMTTNPSVCVKPDGSVLLIYKSSADQSDLLRLGVAAASHYSGPYERQREEPIFQFGQTRNHVEDPYIWWSAKDARYELIMKDMAGGICGEKGGGIHALSQYGIDWHISEPALAYSRRIRWSDGATTMQGHLERPQLLFHGGEPTHLFAATADGPGGFERAAISWNMVLPLTKLP